MLGLFFLLQGRPFHLWLGKLPEAGSRVRAPGAGNVFMPLERAGSVLRLLHPKPLKKLPQKKKKVFVRVLCFVVFFFNFLVSK